ncbi:CYSTEINE DESULFURASE MITOCHONDRIAL [Salix viminalis]|uniref:CYSTEINE DESULFURASE MITOCHONDRIAL n=1 Tax=Salix viminalis TaxID=40686 RepID=A0A9Q0NZL8_SALVM|nr:CYSTEINE DESULFURASE MITOCHONDRIAL [Salix viminalis]
MATSKLLVSTLRKSLTSPSPSSSFRRFSTAAEEAVAPASEPEDSLNIKGVKISARPLYLDMQATSPVDPRVLDAMLPYYLARYGNPHSRTHLYGWESDQAVETARCQVADLIGASPKEIVFTSGATECNNISVKGLKGSIRRDTGLVSVMAVNNEIGVIQPIEEIGKICKELNVSFHTDAAQALGKIPIDVDKWNVSLMSLSGHKIYGPKGSWEWAACELAKKEMEYDDKRIRALQERLLNGVRAKLDGVVVKDVAVSSGSACTSASLEPSYVLRALGVDEDMAHTSIRFGIGRFTTEEEIDRAIELTVQQVEKLREMSPLYEMVEEGIDIKQIQWAQH